MIDLYDDAIREDPYPTYAKLRDLGPVFHDEVRNEYFITQYAECVKMLVDAKSYSSAPSGFEETVVGSNGTVHRVLRGALMPAFAREQRVEYDKLLRRDIYRGLRKLKGEQIDIVTDVAAIASGTLFDALLDMRLREHTIVIEWASRIVQTSRRGLADGEDYAQGSADVSDVMDHLRARFKKATRSRPKALLMALMVHQYKSGQLNSRQLEDLGLLLTLAASETMMSTTAFCGYFLATLPDVQTRLREDPSLIPAFVDEVLRHEAPVQRRPRYSTVDTEIAGVRIPAGSMVTALVGSANRDHRVFDGPDDFRLDRGDNPHLSFGSGPHLCIGRQVGKSSLIIEVDELLKRTKNIELGEAQVVKAHPTNWSIRGPRRLPLRIEVARG